MSSPDSQDSYQVSDIYFAAFLRTKGCNLLGSKKDGSRTFFLFEKTPQLKDLKTHYYNKSAESEVAALDFANNVKDLKSICYMS